MATIFERVQSREGTESDGKADHTLEFVVLIDEATEDEDEVWALIELTALTTHRGIPFKECSIKHQGGGVFFCTAKYEDGKSKESTEPKQDGESTFSFDTTGGSEKIYFSRATVAPTGTGYTGSSKGWVAAPTTGPAAPDFRQGINVKKEGVDGVEIIVPAFKIKVTQCVPAAAMTSAYVNVLFLATGTVNAAAHTMTVGGVAITFAAGELRFDGAQGSLKKKDQWELNYEFTASKGVTLTDTPLTIGDISVTVKRGHDYLWIHYVESSRDGATIQNPRAAYVEQVYRYTNFGALGVGTP